MMTYEVSTSLPLTRPASAALRKPGANVARDLVHRHRVVEAALTAIGQSDDGHCELPGSELEVAAAKKGAPRLSSDRERRSYSIW